MRYEEGGKEGTERGREKREMRVERSPRGRGRRRGRAEREKERRGRTTKGQAKTKLIFFQHTARHGELTPAIIQDEFPYLDMVMKEILRMYTPTYFLVRIAREGAKIAGYDIPPAVGFFFSSRVPQFFFAPFFAR
jgi:hypothetical protein